MSLAFMYSLSVGTSPAVWSGTTYSGGASMVKESELTSELVSSMRFCSSSVRARLSWSPAGGLPCQPPPWSEGLPQPLTVLATTAMGLGEFLSVPRNSSKAALIWAGLWPSMTLTS